MWAAPSCAGLLFRFLLFWKRVELMFFSLIKEKYLRIFPSCSTFLADSYDLVYPATFLAVLSKLSPVLRTQNAHQMLMLQYHWDDAAWFPWFYLRLASDFFVSSIYMWHLMHGSPLAFLLLSDSVSVLISFFSSFFFCRTGAFPSNKSVWILISSVAFPIFPSFCIKLLLKHIHVQVPFHAHCIIVDTSVLVCKFAARTACPGENPPLQQRTPSTPYQVKPQRSGAFCS